MHLLLSKKLESKHEWLKGFLFPGSLFRDHDELVLLWNFKSLQFRIYVQQ